MRRRASRGSIGIEAFAEEVKARADDEESKSSSDGSVSDSRVGEQQKRRRILARVVQQRAKRSRL
eukprot:9145768-Heterocapsa_arctica.AAC.1